MQKKFQSYTFPLYKKLTVWWSSDENGCQLSSHKYIRAVLQSILLIYGLMTTLSKLGMVQSKQAHSKKPLDLHYFQDAYFDYVQKFKWFLCPY